MVIAPARSCIGCGYPIGRGIGVDACPECGVTEVKSAVEWGRRGGEDAAMERLMRAAPLIVSLWIFEAVGQLLLFVSGSIAQASPPWSNIAYGWLMVLLVASAIGAMALWRIDRARPFSAQAHRTLWIRAGVLAWWCLGVISIVTALWPGLAYTMIWHLGDVIPYVAVLIVPWWLSLPLPLTIATLMLIAPASLPHLRRQALWLRRGCVLLLGFILAVIMLDIVSIATWDSMWFGGQRAALLSSLLKTFRLAYPWGLVVPLSTVAAMSMLYLRRVAVIDVPSRANAGVSPSSAVRRVLGGGLLFAGAFAITIMIRIDFVTPSMADGFIFVGLALMVMVLWVVAQFVPVLIMRRASRVSSQRNARV